MKKHLYPALLALAVSFLASCTKDQPLQSELDIELDRTLKLASGNAGRSFFVLPNSNDYSAIPQDANNPINNAKVELGSFLFHETVLAENPRLPTGMHRFSCASCHHAKAGFQANLPQGIGEGGLGFGARGEGRFADSSYPVDSIDLQPIRTPSAMNGAYQRNQLWNGQFGANHMNVGTQASWTPGTPKEVNNLGFDGLETQAIAGLGVHRLKIDTAYLNSLPRYPQLFDQAFPNVAAGQRMTNVNAGLAIAAYERTVMSNQAPFQMWLRGENDAMSDDEKKGALLFFGKAQCGSCHTGPALNSMDFHALGMEDLKNGTYGVISSNPNDGAHKGRGGFTNRAEDMYKFKVPQLYNLNDSRHYGHGASKKSVRDVIVYKNNAVQENPNVPKSQLSTYFKPLNLSNQEIDLITIFVEKSLYDPGLMRYQPEKLPSGYCFPNNDPKSKADTGCL